MGKKVVLCNCRGNIVDVTGLHAISSYIQNIDIELITVSDLCGICVTKKTEAQTLFSTQDELLIIACHPRAVRLLLQNIGVDIKTKQFSFLNFRENRDDHFFNTIQSFANDTSGKSSINIESDPAWPAWYPIIDNIRCSTCGQCADFCLFGVYEKSEGHVNVVNPKGCKNNCPACARICPQAAIVFPKYSEGGAISGSEISDEITELHRQQQDINTILGSDIYAALEQRKSKRRSIIKTDAMDKALEERENALSKKINQ
jgi:Pyruvate/2-oxoacid:ferredoxin oxidoreductase delta subunit